MTRPALSVKERVAYAERAQHFLTHAAHFMLIWSEGNNLAEAMLATAAAIHCIRQVDGDGRALDLSIAELERVRATRSGS